MYKRRELVISEARALAIHWDRDTTPEEFAEFVASAVLGQVWCDLHTRQDLARWERKIREDERRRTAT